MTSIRLGISSCLLGNEVRFDGGHKRNPYIINTLGQYFEFTPVCPEMAIGLGTPRPTLRLVNSEQGVRLVGTKDNTRDVTDEMRAFSDTATQDLHELSGYILKKASPSCGMERVKVYNSQGMPDHNGVGIFAEKLQTRYPDLPIEEEGRLNDAVLRENFIERVFIYYRWQQLHRNGLNVAGLIDFHSRHKFNLLAHNETIYRELGPLVAGSNPENIEETAKIYISNMMKGLKKPATRKRHTNVLMHVAGFFKKSLTADDKEELGETMDKYRIGQLPLIVPITLLKHHLRRAPNPYIERQYYMAPYPEELMLRNSV